MNKEQQVFDAIKQIFGADILCYSLTVLVKHSDASVQMQTFCPPNALKVNS